MVLPLDHPVVSSLLPVVFLILTGWVAGRARLIRAEAVRDLSNLVFLVLTQALLFRTMSSVHIEQLDFRPVSLYFAVAGVLFAALVVARGLNSRSAILALSSIFSNTIMIGIPLIGLAYGESALVLLFTLISLHALVLLTAATVVMELLMAHEQAVTGTGPRRHPVPMPIIAGLLFAQTGWTLPGVVDRPLLLLGNAFGPVALAGWAMGLRGQTLAVLVVAASLPVGANVFLFSQRYQKAEDLVTASVAVSTVLALLSVTLVMTLVPYLG